MGYGVYEANGRWAGYGVPAECDMPDCAEQIDRGLAYKCEDHNGDGEGCGLFFCETHQYDTGTHEAPDVTPKPDSAEWVSHVLSDESWNEWRSANAERVALMKAQLTAAVQIGTRESRGADLRAT